jgi:hypothetical protein
MLNVFTRTFFAPSRAALWLLLLGMSIRLLALNRPLVDAHMFRQL